MFQSQLVGRWSPSQIELSWKNAHSEGLLISQREFTAFGCGLDYVRNSLGRRHIDFYGHGCRRFDGIHCLIVQSETLVHLTIELIHEDCSLVEYIAQLPTIELRWLPGFMFGLATAMRFNAYAKNLLREKWVANPTIQQGAHGLMLATTEEERCVNHPSLQS